MNFMYLLVKNAVAILLKACIDFSKLNQNVLKKLETFEEWSKPYTTSSKLSIRLKTVHTALQNFKQTSEGNIGFEILVATLIVNYLRGLSFLTKKKGILLNRTLPVLAVNESFNRA